jgi:3-hydroxyphenylacetate 6-hydroxylase
LANCIDLDKAKEHNMATATALSVIQQCILLSPLQSLTIATFIILSSYIIANEFIRASARVPGLKGPRGLPLIGNIAQIRKNAAEQYRIWSKTYGPVYQIQLGNIPIIIVNSAATAKAIFGQNAQALSSRPEFYTFHKVRLIKRGPYFIDKL